MDYVQSLEEEFNFKIKENKRFVDDITLQLESILKTDTTLTKLPEKLNHSIMMPLNTVGFMKANLKHTNEIFVSLGQDYFVWKTVPEAKQVLERRKEKLVETKNNLETQKTNILNNFNQSVQENPDEFTPLPQTNSLKLSREQEDRKFHEDMERLLKLEELENQGGTPIKNKSKESKLGEIEIDITKEILEEPKPEIQINTPEVKSNLNSNKNIKSQKITEKKFMSESPQNNNTIPKKRSKFGESFQKSNIENQKKQNFSSKNSSSAFGGSIVERNFEDS